MQLFRETLPVTHFVAAALQRYVFFRQDDNRTSFFLQGSSTAKGNKGL